MKREISRDGKTIDIALDQDEDPSPTDIADPRTSIWKRYGPEGWTLIKRFGKTELRDHAAPKA